MDFVLTALDEHEAVLVPAAVLITNPAAIASSAWNISPAAQWRLQERHVLLPRLHTVRNRTVARFQFTAKRRSEALSMTVIAPTALNWLISYTGAPPPPPAAAASRLLSVRSAQHARRPAGQRPRRRVCSSRRAPA